MSLEAGATPDTPAVPEGLSDELVFVDEFEFERRQHGLEVETWSRQRKELEDALTCRRAQLDAYAEKLWSQESRLTSREAEIELVMKELQARDERLTMESNELDLERERLEKRD